MLDTLGGLRYNETLQGLSPEEKEVFNHNWWVIENCLFALGALPSTPTVVVDPIVGDHGLLTGLADDDHLQYLLLAGRVGGQIAYGDTAANGILTLSSTFHSDKGFIYWGSAQTSMFDEGQQFLGLNVIPEAMLHIRSTAAGGTVTLIPNSDIVKTMTAYTTTAGTSTGNTAFDALDNDDDYTLYLGNISSQGTTKCGLNGTLPSSVTEVTINYKSAWFSTPSLDSSIYFFAVVNEDGDMWQSANIPDETTVPVNPASFGANSVTIDMSGPPTSSGHTPNAVWIQGPNKGTYWLCSYVEVTYDSGPDLVRLAHQSNTVGVRVDGALRVGIGTELSDLTSIVTIEGGAGQSDPHFTIRSDGAIQDLFVVDQFGGLIINPNGDTTELWIQQNPGQTSDSIFVEDGGGFVRARLSALGRFVLGDTTSTTADSTLRLEVLSRSTQTELLARFLDNLGVTMISVGPRGQLIVGSSSPSAADQVVFQMRMGPTGRANDVWQTLTTAGIAINRMQASGRVLIGGSSTDATNVGFNKFAIQGASTETENLFNIISGIADTTTLSFNQRAVLAAGRISHDVRFTDDNTNPLNAKLLALALGNITAGVTRTWTPGNYSGIPAVPTNEGTSGLFLKSTGAGNQPIWDTPAGGGGSAGFLAVTKWGTD